MREPAIVLGQLSTTHGRVQALRGIDEAPGRLDLILARPASRAARFWGRVLAFPAATMALMAIRWLGYVLPLGGSSIDVTWGEMALPFLTLRAQILVYGTLALLLPARRLAGAVAGLVMVASYVLTALASLSDRLEPVARLLPYDYYQGGAAIDGLDLTRFAGLLAVSAAFVLLAGWAFRQRDIRAGGWQLPLLARRSAR